MTTVSALFFGTAGVGLKRLPDNGRMSQWVGANGRRRGATEFASLHEYAHFAKSVVEEARFLHTGSVKEFLNTVKETSESRIRRLDKERIFYRAQRGYTEREEIVGDGDVIGVQSPFDPERMIPDSRFVGHGRANPKGIAYLYIATTAETAMAEVRPWLDARISLAEFRITRDCRIVDCSREAQRSWHIAADLIPLPGDTMRDPTPEEKETGVWGDIAYAFSKPVEVMESELSYLPTQVLAEAFRDAGYDGIGYNSTLVKGGKNVVLFDMSAAEIVNCGLHIARVISYSFEDTLEFYSIRNRGQEPTYDEQADEIPDELRI